MYFLVLRPRKGGHKMKVISESGAERGKNARRWPLWPSATFFPSDKARLEKRRMTGRLYAAAALRLFLLLALPHSASGWEKEPLLTHYEEQLGDEFYSVFYVEPIDIEARLLSLSRDKRRRAFYQFQEMRRQTNAILHIAIRQVRPHYLRKGTFTWRTGEKLFEALEHTVKGKDPVIIIAKDNDPYTVYYTLSGGKDEGQGIPTEHRAVGRGMTALERKPKRPEVVQIRYFPKHGQLREIKEVSEFLSAIPHWVGGNAEAKLYSNPNHSPRNFRSLIQRVALAQQIFLWNGEKIPEADRLPPLTGETLARALELKAKYPDLPDELLFPDKQIYYINDTLYTHALRRALAKIYERDWGFSAPIQTFNDPDNEDKPAFISRIDRVEWEQRTPDLLAKSDDANFAENGKLSTSRWDAFECYRTISVRDLRKEDLERKRRWTVPRFFEVRHHVIPTGSYFRKYREFPDYLR